MSKNKLNAFPDLKDHVVVITGGTGVLGSEISVALAELGVKLAIIKNRSDIPEEAEKRLKKTGTEYRVFTGNILKRSDFENCFKEVLDHFGHVDFLINGAGGNAPGASTSPEREFFDLPEEDLRFVNDLNVMGTVIPSQVAGKYFAEKQEGVILNISSMAAIKPLTKIPGYAASKAAVSNFTQWLAVHMAREYSPDIRVNAVAPGFFLTRQNEFLLKDKETGEWTERGRSILRNTPQGRFGKPEDLVSTVVWLLSPASRFVTGIVVPVDGGFSAFGGV